MHTRKKRAASGLILVLCMPLFCAAAAAAGAGGYLNYQEPPPAQGASWLSMAAYVGSLLATFAVVLGLAYLTSRFLGGKFGRMGGPSSSKIISTLPLGANKGVYVVEIAGRYMILGVTDHAISLLREITDETEIETLRRQPPETLLDGGSDRAFGRQVQTLRRIARRIPAVLDKGGASNGDTEREKR